LGSIPAAAAVPTLEALLAADAEGPRAYDLEEALRAIRK